ncbi:MAG: hypothetical protein ACLVBY_02305 [Oscillospiraceae bacterium]
MTIQIKGNDIVNFKCGCQVDISPEFDRSAFRKCSSQIFFVCNSRFCSQRRYRQQSGAEAEDQEEG